MKGIITKTLGGFFFVADKNQDIYKTEIRGKIQKKVYPGDYVDFHFDNDSDQGVIEKVYPRDNLLKRPAVANVEQVIVMQSFKKPPLDRKLLDRFLVMVKASDLYPLIVINKKDLIENIASDIIKDYEAADFDIFTISVKKEDQLEELYDFLKGKVTVLAGPSGVGKSSLINKLIPGAELEVKPVSDNSNRGIHTTRQVQLLPFQKENKKGWIVDTPGFTSLELDNIAPEELEFLYPEFDKYRNQCKFNMCSHTHEPKCAVKEAVTNQEISVKRYETYKKIRKELESKEETYD